MKSRQEDSQRESFIHALEGKKIPILTLDNKWYQLLTQEGRDSVSELEQQLNQLLKQQGKLNNEVKDIKRLKKRLMGEIVSAMDEAGQDTDSEKSQKLDQNKTLVEECNDAANFQLMLATMDCCYDTMQENMAAIRETDEWVSEIRIELKKRLVKKQEMEQRNHAIYSYMHDVFGAEVIDIFDMQYNPDLNPGQA